MRVKWIDILKAIGIIGVVIGHSKMPPLIHDFIYWFHMPLFFFISGYLYNRDRFSYISKIRTLLIPYFSFYILITLIRIKTQSLTFDMFMKDDLWRLLQGGEQLRGYYGVFWFITCLFAVSIMYHLMIKYMKPQWMIHLFVLFFYILSYINAVYYKETVFYWNVNVALYAIVFYHLGFMYKKYPNAIKRFKIAIVSVSSISMGSLLYFVVHKGFEYHLDLKYQTYQQFGLDILIPLSLIVLLIFISNILANSKAITNILSPVGESSLTIMYMHVSILIVFPLHITNYYLVVLLAILLPFVFHQRFLKHTMFTSLLFLGRK